MTPEEKAKELVNKFRPYSYSSDGLNSMEREYQIEDNSKQCALIAVDEIKEVVSLCIPYKDEKSYIDYWQQVKHEIINL